MGRKGFERISQREFARRLGVSNETVSQAVKDGKISKGWEKKEKKILFEKAMEEWGNLYLDATQEGNEATAEALKRLHSVVTPAQNIIQELKDKTPKSQRPPSFRDEEEDTEQAAFNELKEYELKVSSHANFAEALRVEKVAKARQEIIKLRKETGDLVNKAEVYKSLFGFGQSVRNAILVVPDRAIDEILAAPNRALAHQVLTKYIHEALTKLTDVDNISLQENEEPNSWGYTEK